MLTRASVALVSKGDDAVGQLQVLRAAEEEFKQFKISRSEKYGEMEKEHRQLTDNLFLTELKLRNANEVRQKLDRLFREKQDEIEAYIGMSEEEIHDMLMKTQERAKDEKSGDELRKMFGDTIERGKRDGEKSREVMDKISYSKVSFVSAFNLDEPRRTSLATSLTPAPSEAQFVTLDTIEPTAPPSQAVSGIVHTPSTSRPTQSAPSHLTPEPAPEAKRQSRFSKLFSQLSPTHNRYPRDRITSPTSPKSPQKHY